MPEFLKLTPVPQALDILLSHVETNVISERLQTYESLGRVTAAAVCSPISMPPFPRATVDGFAVRAADTFGASESLPAYLKLAGEVKMGKEPGFDIKPGEVGLIHTGGMLPVSSDAVVMIEYTQAVGAEMVEILRSVAVGENTIKVGEDVLAGEEVIRAGARIRPQEVGGLLALGFLQVDVARKPLVGIISTGDEVVPPEHDLALGQVRDINSYSLAALVEKSGGLAKAYGIIPDEYEQLFSVASQALSECDMLLITAGSSASARDLTSLVINNLGSPGVLVHGVNIRPGKPTILAVCDRKVVIGLPGNPVSALVIAGFYVVPVVESLLGLRDAGVRFRLRAKLTTNVPSQAGREDWVAGYLQGIPPEYVVEPIFSKSNLIFSLVRANCLIRVPPDATGLAEGELVEVLLLS
ncbi:MAG: molybdopterin molybdenumtransferase MoeA [Anaerolineales bacterium]|nr:molybdopterin molybdenumtransferase MoeA [Anaerolineae bacterium]PWB54445.1 MAG: molybdopterin molybdenumtransferase MoeA [Anaerolineales bacterium]